MKPMRMCPHFWCWFALFILLVTLTAPHLCRANDEIVPREVLDRMVRPLVDGGWVSGVAIGLIDTRGTQQIGYGRISQSNHVAPGPDTLFEIGSITKVFTGILLADMAERGTVALEDPVQELLAHSMIVPQGQRAITLVDLSTHSSGLPRMPTNFSPRDPSNPYADYTVAQMGEFLAKCKLLRQPGAQSVYSNLGVGLLGHALAIKGGYDYESLVEKYVCEPLELTSTRITLSDNDLQRLAVGHDYDGNAVSNWDIPALAGAGALRSTTSDMLKFLAANMRLKKTPIDAAIAASQQVHFKNPEKADHDVGLGWMLRRSDGVIWHNGGTGGYSTFAGFRPEKQVGAVVLVSTSTRFADQLGNRLLRVLQGEEAEAFDVPLPIELDEAQLEPLVGRYKLSDLMTAEITRDGSRLFLQMTGQPKIGIYPTTPTHFFCRPVDATFDFALETDGPATQLMIHQNGLDLPAKRVVESAAE